MKYIFLFLISAMLIVGCTTKAKYDPQDGLDAFTEVGFETHLKKLSSDEFMGRMPFTEGETKTLAYLEDEIKKLGLEPGNGTSYLQEVPMVEITTETDSILNVKGEKQLLKLSGLKDYVIWTPRADQEKIDLQNEELVFAGYGVVAPEYNWNDYASIDVKDKIVLVIVNDPGFGVGDSTFFKGNTMT
jgi:hypothetical protein